MDTRFLPPGVNFIASETALCNADENLSMSLHIIKLKDYAYWNAISPSFYNTLEESLQKHLHIRQLGRVLPIYC